LTEGIPGFGAELDPHEPHDSHDPHVPLPVPDEVADYSPEELAPSLAAVCFALNRPVTLPEAAAILGRGEPVIAAAAAHLAGTLRGGGLMLQRHQEELQLVTRPEVAWAVHRALNPEKPGRLSRAALETLAIVAYRQPLTRAAAEAIRGVNCEAVLDSLERRGLIAEVGRQDTPGHPRLFGTTLRFLQVVGLERIEDLPPLPEGLRVPELPAVDWDVAPDEPLPADGAMEVRGEPVPTDTSGYATGGTSTTSTYDADPDEGYGEPDDPDAPSTPGPQAEAPPEE
jgi:segregation and condensation protein B